MSQEESGKLRSNLYGAPKKIFMHKMRQNQACDSTNDDELSDVRSPDTENIFGNMLSPLTPPGSVGSLGMLSPGNPDSVGSALLGSDCYGISSPSSVGKKGEDGKWAYKAPYKNGKDIAHAQGGKNGSPRDGSRDSDSQDSSVKSTKSWGRKDELPESQNVLLSRFHGRGQNSKNIENLDSLKKMGDDSMEGLDDDEIRQLQIERQKVEEEKKRVNEEWKRLEMEKKKFEEEKNMMLPNQDIPWNSLAQTVAESVYKSLVSGNHPQFFNKEGAPDTVKLLHTLAASSNEKKGSEKREDHSSESSPQAKDKRHSVDSNIPTSTFSKSLPSSRSEDKSHVKQEADSSQPSHFKDHKSMYTRDSPTMRNHAFPHMPHPVSYPLHSAALHPPPPITSLDTQRCRYPPDMPHLAHTSHRDFPNPNMSQQQQQPSTAHTNIPPHRYNINPTGGPHPLVPHPRQDYPNPAQINPFSHNIPSKQMRLEEVSEFDMDINNLLDNKVSIKMENFEEETEGLPSQCSLVEGSGKIDESHICQVCGDIAAGFHCGTYVCEACKKFFVRCVKTDGGVKFVCPRNKNCPITKETRTQCQYCRYQKCLAVGMYKPGGTNISSEIAHIPCKVCGAPSSGYHFGAITCEGCKGFFRRTVKERDSMKYQCSRNGMCIITTATRNICKFCRYQKCIDVGMKPDGSRIGRQPNSVKHATMMELRQIKVQKGIPPDFPSHDFNKLDLKMESTDYERFNMMAAASGMPPSTQAMIRNDFMKHYGALDPHHAFPPHPHQPLPMHPFSDPRHHHRRPPPISIPVPGSYPSSQHLYTSPSEPTSMCISPESKLSTVKSSSTSSSISSTHNRSPSGDSGICSSVESVNHGGGSGKYPFDGNTPPQPSYQSSLTPTMEDQKISDLPAPYSSSASPAATMTSPTRNSPVTMSQASSESETRTVSSAEIKPIENKPQTTSKPNPKDIDSLSLDDVMELLNTGCRMLRPIRTRNQGDRKTTMDDGKKSVWDDMMNMFSTCAHSTLKFAKNIPGFRNLPIGDQITMVQTSMYAIVISNLSLDYKLETNYYNYFNFDKEEEAVQLHYFTAFKLLIPTLENVGKVIQKNKMDDVEVAYLCGIQLLSVGEDAKSQDLLARSFKEYCRRKYGEVNDRADVIKECMAELVEANKLHLQSVYQVSIDNQNEKDLEIPQLFQETFLND